jgi:glycosyltransferase involved in cell wall biosynthesis
MKKSIAIDGRPLYGPWNGTTSYIKTVIEVLLRSDFDVTLVTDKPIAVSSEVPFKNCRIELIDSHHGFKWEQIALRKYLNANDYDIYFVGSNMGLPLFYFGKTKLILGLLDIIPMMLPRIYLLHPPFKSIITYLLPQVASILKAEKIVTISKTSAKDIKRVFPFKRIESILMRMPDTVKSTVAEKKKEQFVYVGGVDPRKQLTVLLQAFKAFLEKHPQFKFVFIGKHYELIDGDIRALGLEKNVIKTGYVSDQEKMKIISESTAMVYPSLYEGYGLAIAESMLAHTPILVGPGGSQREIGGDAVLYIDPKNSQDIVSKMEEILDTELQKELINKSESQVALLSSAELDDQLAQYFQKLVT